MVAHHQIVFREHPSCVREEYWPAVCSGVDWDTPGMLPFQGNFAFRVNTVNCMLSHSCGRRQYSSYFKQTPNGILMLLLETGWVNSFQSDQTYSDLNFTWFLHHDIYVDSDFLRTHSQSQSAQWAVDVTAQEVPC